MAADDRRSAAATAIDGNDSNYDRPQDDIACPSPQEEQEESPLLIQPIPSQAIQRIVAGQAITDLSSAVKELVDNAIDAGAQRVTSEWSCMSIIVPIISMW